MKINQKGPYRTPEVPRSLTLKEVAESVRKGYEIDFRQAFEKRIENIADDAWARAREGYRNGTASFFKIVGNWHPSEELKGELIEWANGVITEEGLAITEIHYASNCNFAYVKFEF